MQQRCCPGRSGAEETQWGLRWSCVDDLCWRAFIPKGGEEVQTPTSRSRYTRVSLCVETSGGHKSAEGKKTLIFWGDVMKRWYVVRGDNYSPDLLEYVCEYNTELVTSFIQWTITVLLQLLQTLAYPILATLNILPWVQILVYPRIDSSRFQLQVPMENEASILVR